MVYLDKNQKSGWSHLVADNIFELQIFAKSIGLKESWMKVKKDRPHYVVRGIMRERAIIKGVMMVNTKDIVNILKENKNYKITCN